MSAQTLMAAIDRLTLAVATAVQELDGIERELLALEDKTCNGTVYWRASSDGSAPMMYANHKHDQTCPLHGTPAPGRRLRTYIGKKPYRQDKATTAMELHRQRTRLLHRQRALTYALDTTNPINAITARLQ